MSVAHVCRVECMNAHPPPRKTVPTTTATTPCETTITTYASTAIPPPTRIRSHGAMVRVRPLTTRAKTSTEIPYAAVSSPASVTESPEACNTTGRNVNGPNKTSPSTNTSPSTSSAGPLRSTDLIDDHTAGGGPSSGSTNPRNRKDNAPAINAVSAKAARHEVKSAMAPAVTVAAAIPTAEL